MDLPVVAFIQQYRAFIEQYLDSYFTLTILCYIRSVATSKWVNIYANTFLHYIFLINSL